MKPKTSFCLPSILILTLGILCLCGFADNSANKHSRPKKVFTNDDLQKYQEEGQASSDHDGVATDNEKKVNLETSAGSNLEVSDKTADGKSFWSKKLKESEGNLSQAKMEEQKFRKSLADFQEKLGVAKTEFQKKTLKWQIEDTETNLDRSIARRKKAEEDKGNILAEAAKKGFKLEDLNKEEEPIAKSSQ